MLFIYLMVPFMIPFLIKRHKNGDSILFTTLMLKSTGDNFLLFYLKYQS